MEQYQNPNQITKSPGKKQDDENQFGMRHSISVAMPGRAGLDRNHKK